ncbi:MAG: gluconokinase, GntK/IdnK-type [Lentisphaeria bacterium]
MIYVAMGVAGCGKTTLGERLAAWLGVAFHDADAFHPPANVEKMKHGQPLNDADRAPWLAAMAAAMPGWEQAGGAVLACSALKRAYRAVLRGGLPGGVRFIFLDGTKEAIGERMTRRQGHFMPVSLLDSQFATLERPRDAIAVAAILPADEQVRRVLAALGGPVAGAAGLPADTLLLAEGAPDREIAGAELARLFKAALAKLGPRRKVLLLPPDITRLHSRAGELTRLAWEHFGSAVTDIMPALGTHAAMTSAEIATMFPGVPAALFRVHDWRRDVVTLGEVPGDYLRELSGGRLDTAWPAQVNRLLVEGGFDLILSLGQVVPHEVIGMANYNKNIFVGTGGAAGINGSHFLGAVHGMERIMGRADTPVRRVLNYASAAFGAKLPLVYVHTVIGRTAAGGLAMRGLFAGNGPASFFRAAELAREVNFQMLERPLRKVVAYLDPEEYKSTWLGNKSIYRTRMAMADGGELVVLAPGLRQFGEDPAIDGLIRKYGYHGTPATLAAVRDQADLAGNLSAAAHLIHGSTEGRFTVTYCPGQLTRAEIEGAGFQYGDLAAMLRRYDPAVLRDGVNVLPDGEEIYYISNPALGLWACRERFEAEA